METETKLNLLCCICESGINLDIGESSVEICHKFQIYTNKFLNSALFSKEKSEITNESICDGTDDDNPKNKFIVCCVKCATDVKTFCEMWESLESLHGEMIRAVVNISNLTKFQSPSEKGIIQKRSPVKNCFICQAVPSSKSNVRRKVSEIETCLKFITFITRFVLNTQKPSFDKKILQSFVEMRNIRSFVSVYCCDICLAQLVTFCEMYEAMDSLRLEVLRILDRISNKSKHFQSSVENCRKQSFPRVKLEKLKCLARTIDQVGVEPQNINIKREFMEVTDTTTSFEIQPELDDEHVDSSEMASNGIPSPSSSLRDNNYDESAERLELEAAAPVQPLDISQSFDMTNPTKCESLLSSGYKGACLFCDKKFTSSHGLEPHLRSHTGERAFICSICLIEYSHKCALLNHRRFRHFPEKNLKPLMACEFCGKRCQRKSELESHVQAVHEKLKPYKCDVCGKGFFQRAWLRVHQNIHLDKSERIHSCDICGKTYSWSCSLRDHKLSVHEGKGSGQRICEICGKSFMTQRNVSRHIQSVHQKLNLKPHKCDACGEMFVTRYRLEKHKLYVHNSGKEKYSKGQVCHICGKNVSYKRNSLLQHLNKHHPSEIDEGLTLGKKFKCTVADCHWSFYENRDLQRHMLKHTGEKNFKCDQCGKDFTLEFQLKRHQQCHKEVRPYVCTHCGKGFNYKFRLTGHEKKYHSHSSENVTSNDVIENLIS